MSFSTKQFNEVESLQKQLACDKVPLYNISTIDLEPRGIEYFWTVISNCHMLSLLYSNFSALMNGIVLLTNIFISLSSKAGWNFK